ncbi:universal stress protein [Knoellia locipacati]|uniref:Universal stress protein n=1 Tax=Knoellia locipacati TaxID=882824 RepID=A0A512T0B4_9MICO|nr:universal stress protein [Knoellia locipacati]GEQ13646.1 universal stress protein [Knoellia locipacati]
MSTTETRSGHAVVVGVDSGQSTGRAVEEAAAHARRWGSPLRVMHATGLTIVPWTDEHLLRLASHTEKCRQRALRVAPDLTVTAVTEVDDPAAMLVEASHDASMLVLDGGRLGQAEALLLGATADKVMAHAECPVMIVPLGADLSATGPVVVGVDAHEHSAPAVALAFAEASKREVPLHAVHSWWWDEANAAFTRGDPDEARERVVESHRLIVAEMLAGYRDEYPDVKVSESLVHGIAGPTLVQESRGAQLLVVGRRGRGGFPGLLLGSVGAHVVHHAHCPVVVVPSTPADRRGAGGETP